MSMNNHQYDTHTSDPDVRTATPRDIAAAVGEDAPVPLRTLLNHARRVTYGPHDVIYHQGSPVSSVTFITSGLLKLIVHLPNGRARIVRLHRPGSVLGLGGLRERNHEHTAIAVSPVTALRLPMSAIKHLRAVDPETYLTLAERWHDYLHDADIWITQFSTGPIRGRVARLLSYLADINRESAGDRLHLLTCEEMGSVLGVTSESTSRILAEFKRKQILASGNYGEDETYDADLGRLLQIAEQA
jgi:CRP-like cAMP-binding protein